MNGSIRIGHLRGVLLKAHWSVPLLIVLFGYGLGDQTLPAWLPGRPMAVYAVAAAVGSVLLLASLIVHETAHALTARRTGSPVHDMTLWALGGVTRMEPPKTARAAFAVAVSGPLASLAVGGIALAAAVGTNAVLDWVVPAAVLLWLGWANLLLGIFNLLPAAPLDGGRVLQSVVWWRTGDEQRAQRVAGRSGQIFGVLLIGGGAFMVLGGAAGGLWLALIGTFVALAASAERQRATLGVALRGMKVSEAMSAPVTTGPDWLTVNGFIDQVAAHTHHSTLPLLDFEGRPSGVVEVRRLAAVPQARRDAIRVRDVALPLSRCIVAEPGELLDEVLGRMTPATRLPILAVDGHHVEGIITSHDISRILQQHTLGRGTGPADRSR